MSDLTIMCSTPRIFLYLAILLSHSLFAQQYNFRNYSIESGLPQSTVYSIFQDVEGFLWFGTQGGVAKFDGKTFVSWSQSDGMADNHVKAIAQDIHGNIWTGHRYDGVSCKYGDHWFHAYPEGLNSDIRSICRKGEHVIVVSGSDGIFELSVDEEGIHLVDHLTPGQLGASVCHVIKEHGEKLFVCTDQGVICPFEGEEETYFKGLNVFDLDWTLAGEMLVVSSEGVFIDSGSEEIVSSRGIETNLLYTSVIATTGGDVWLGSADGVLNLRGADFRIIGTNNGLSNDEISCIVEDSEGNIWFGLTGTGASQYVGDQFETYTSRQGLRNEVVQALILDHRGRLWSSGTNTLDILEFYGSTSGSIRRSINVDEKRPGLGNVMAIFQDSRKWFWLGTDQGVKVLDSNFRVIRKLGKADGLSHDYAISITEDGNGNIWLASLWHGATKITIRGNDFEFEAMDKETGMPSDNYWVAYTDSKGRVLLGSDDAGIVVFDGNKKSLINEDHGLTGLRAGTISEDPYGNIWIGTIGGGVFKYDGQSCQAFTTKDGLSADNPYLVLCDDLGNVWIGTNTGLDVLPNGELPVKHFGAQKGFLGVETNQNAMFKDKNGHLWFGTVKGVVKCNPAAMEEEVTPPQTYITNKSLFLRDEIPGDRTSFSYDENHITFEFVGLHFSNPDGVKYSYILEGFDKTWSPPEDRTYATYSYIPPGNYIFKVKAQNGDGYQSEAVLYTFEIVPPFWATAWFYIAVLMVLVVSVIGIMRVRTIKIRKNQKRLEEEVKLRTRELELERQRVVNQKDIIEAKNKNITDSINYARTIQESVLPNPKVLEENLKDHFIFYQPRDIVSGDFYWFKKKGDYLILTASDCTGHGVPGAFMSMLGSELLNQIVNDPEVSSPAKAIELLDEGVFNALHRNSTSKGHDGMDAAICALNLKTKVLTYSGAFRPIVVWSSDQISVYKPVTCSIGNFKERGVEPMEQQIQLSEGDRVYMFSDGFVDQFGGEKGKKFMSKRFVRLIEEIQRMPLGEQCQVLEEHFEEWRGDQEQVDDVLVMAVEV